MPSFLSVQNEVSSLVSLRSSKHHQALIVSQPAQPALNVGRAVVDDSLCYAAMATQECAAHFRDKLFLRVIATAEGCELFRVQALEPRFVAGGVRQLVEQRRVILGVTGEKLRRWHVHNVSSWPIASLRCFVLDDWPLRHRAHHALSLLDWLECSGIVQGRHFVRRNALTLLHIENAIVAKQWRAVRLKLAIGVLALVLQPLPEDNRR